MTDPAPSPPSLNLLLLIDDPAWRDVTKRALTRLKRGQTTAAASPIDALYRLVSPTNKFSHLLVQPSAAGGMMEDLIGMTSGEAGSPTILVVLGQPPRPMPGYSVISSPRPRALADALVTPPDRSKLPKRPYLMAGDIREALDNGYVECRFQPIVRIADARPVGLEALARLYHPTHGTFGPHLFIPQAEHAGLAQELTEAVANSAMTAMGAAFLEYHDLFLTINMPLDVLLNPDTMLRIDAYRAATGIPPERLLIELTESRPVWDIPVLAAALDRWRSAGYRIAIEDLGPSMVNQIELFQLPFHTVKLDKEVVLQSQVDRLAERYLQRTVANALSRPLNIIAEGIEDEALWVRMRDFGADQAQGFLVSRALPASALPIWLDAWRAHARLPRGPA